MQTKTANFNIAAVLAIALLLVGCFGSSSEEFLAAAKIEISKNNRDTAIIQLKNSLQKNPKLAEARFLLGQLLLENEDARGAIIELRKAQEFGYDNDKLPSKFIKFF